MAKVSNVSFSVEATNNITDAYVAYSATKDAIGVEKEKGESYNLAMYSEVIAVMNGCKLNAKNKLYREDALAIKGEIGVALGNGKGADAKAKRLYENSFKAVKHFNVVSKDEDKLPSGDNATASAIREHLVNNVGKDGVFTESALAALGKEKVDGVAALVRKVSGQLVTQKTVKGKKVNLEQPIYKDGLSDEDLQSFQDQLAVAIAERFAYRDAEAAQKAGAKVGVENDTVNASLDALAA